MTIAMFLLSLLLIYQVDESLTCGSLWGSGTTTPKPDGSSEEKAPDGVVLPELWQGFGKSMNGTKVPSESIVPNAYGKPEFCFEKPKKGECTTVAPNISITIAAEKRWYYNSVNKKCEEFTYSGCGGNTNNFKYKPQCEESCVNDAQSNCKKYGEYIEY